MREKIAMLTDRARKSLESAKLLADSGYNEPSVSRCYYAMFYAAEAILLTRELKFSSHKGVISSFGQHFVKTNIFPAQLGRDLSKAYDERLIGDYVFKPEITREIVKKAIQRAENFIKSINEYLVKEGY